MIAKIHDINGKISMISAENAFLFNKEFWFAVKSFLENLLYINIWRWTLSGDPGLCAFLFSLSLTVS